MENVIIFLRFSLLLKHKWLLPCKTIMLRLNQIAIANCKPFHLRIHIHCKLLEFLQLITYVYFFIAIK